MFLRVKNLEFKVANKTILNKQNFSVSKSKHLLISGSSGSGKTTLMNLMSGLLKPTSGFISFEDNDFSKLTNPEVGFNNPDIKFIKVVFPDPEEPEIIRCLLLDTEKFCLFNIALFATLNSKFFTRKNI